MEEQLVIEEFAASPEGEPFLLELGSWEGPLDLLLALARSQKVDLREISILALVEQYLDFIANAKALKLEIAADYLVMAAWLAYLKSCLLLPREPHVDPSPEELALRLQLRLERLNAMREAGARLMGRDRLGRDVFARGLPDGLRIIRKAKWDAQIFDLIQAYGQNTKWLWSFPELYAKSAVLGKNMIDFREVQSKRDPREEFFYDRKELVQMVKDDLLDASNRYRDKYEISTKATGDLIMLEPHGRERSPWRG